MYRVKFTGFPLGLLTEVDVHIVCFYFDVALLSIVANDVQLVISLTDFFERFSQRLMQSRLLHQ